MKGPECAVCKRRALWRIRPNCACEIKWPIAVNGALLACTAHIGQTVRLFSGSHGPHTGLRATEVVLSEIPRR